MLKTLEVFHPQTPGRQAKDNGIKPFPLSFACLNL
jgi:hypothetical protein